MDSMVLWFQGPVAVLGLGTSERSWRLALRRVEPTVSMPTSAPAFKKLMPLRGPLPPAFWAHAEFESLGSRLGSALLAELLGASEAVEENMSGGWLPPPKEEPVIPETDLLLP